MFFTNPRSIHRTNKEYTQNTIIKRPNIGMNMVIPINNNATKASTTNQVQSTNPKIIVDMTWGKAYWLFFHTIAVKIKPEYYLQYRDHLFGIVTEICNNLPCPNCAQHASEYIKKIDVKSLKTKDDFIMCLFIFHNSVNKRKSFPEFSVDELRSKYSTANLKNIINYFIHYYRMDYRSIRMIADTMHRQRSATRILQWLQSNVNLFNL
jgi:hypothetical protein